MCLTISVFRYTEVANNVQTQETILNIQFVLLDCSPLKAGILAHCEEWQNKFTTLLSEIAITCLKDLSAFLKDNAYKYMTGHMYSYGNIYLLLCCVHIWKTHII